MATDPALLASTATIAVPPIVPDVRRHCRRLYWMGWGVTQIADELGLNRATVEAWKQREKWDDAPSIRKCEDAIEPRWCMLVAKDKKTGAEMKEIDLLGRQIERLARVRRYEAEGGHEGDLNGAVGNRNAGEKKEAKPQNYFTAEQVAQLREIFEEEMFGYNRTWEAAKIHRNRMVLKSRQIGATFHFAREALLDALEGPNAAGLGGGNQIFLSASKNQARVFRAYIMQFAERVGVKLKGDPIAVRSELMPEEEPVAELYFLGTNFKTAQSYHGNFYFDEFFWVAGFEKINTVASAMATHKRWRRTYMSTPSTIAHEAHPYWTGERRNKNRKKADRISIDLSHAALKNGSLGPDRYWRHLVTVKDAEAAGCTLFDIEELQDEYAPDQFSNLFMCEFVDDSLSAFKFNDMVACGVDTIVEWRDVNMEASSPYAGDVWAGYDPQESEDGDNAALVIAAAPARPGEPFRLIERHQLRGLDFEQQAVFITSRLSRYRCTYLGVDNSNGMGAAVMQQLRKPKLLGGKGVNIVAIGYDLATKAQMIIKAQHTVQRLRLRFDAGWLDIISAFVSIKKALTPSGRSVTFKAGRAGGDGHADLAWATMHILLNEAMDGQASQGATVEMF